MCKSVLCIPRSFLLWLSPCPKDPGTGKIEGSSCKHHSHHWFWRYVRSAENPGSFFLKTDNTFTCSKFFHTHGFQFDEHLVLLWTWSVILYSFLYNKVFGPGRVDPFRAQICCVRYRQSGGGYVKNGDRSKIQMDVEEMSVFWRQHWPTWALWTEESTVAWMWLKKAFDYGCWRRQQGSWS